MSDADSKEGRQSFAQHTAVENHSKGVPGYPTPEPYGTATGYPQQPQYAQYPPGAQYPIPYPQQGQQYVGQYPAQPQYQMPPPGQYPPYQQYQLPPGVQYAAPVVQYQVPPGQYPPPGDYAHAGYATAPPIIIMKQDDSSFLVGFCLSVVLSIFIGPLFSLLLLLCYQQRNGRYGVLAGCGTMWVIYGVIVSVIGIIVWSGGASEDALYSCMYYDYTTTKSYCQMYSNSQYVSYSGFDCSSVTANITYGDPIPKSYRSYCKQSYGSLITSGQIVFFLGFLPTIIGSVLIHIARREMAKKVLKS
jgi:hypothetical protein